MRSTACLIAVCAALLHTQTPVTPQAPVPAPEDPIRTLVGRLELEKYKATIKGLTAFGDRREGTERNRKAVDWIEAQLKSYGCDTARVSYDPTRRTDEAGTGGGQGGQRRGGRAAGRGNVPQRTPAGTPEDPVRRGAGGKGYGARTGVNNDPARQPDEALRKLNMEPVIPGNVDQVYCTKIGATRPDEMYIIGAHMDGIGYGSAANDDGSGTALVMELARIFNQKDVVSDVSIRFALWNGEEGGLKGANAYIAQRRELQGKEDPAGSGKYPEPKWLGMIQHDMMLWDHGNPVQFHQSLDADVDIEFQLNSAKAAESAQLALLLLNSNRVFATDYPAAMSNSMSNTDSGPFMDLVAAVSLRENRRLYETGRGANPHWHRPTDLYSNFSDADFRLGFNAAQTTLGAVARLVEARITPK